MTDAQLVQQAAAGDRGAFRVLVERHRGLVYRLAYQFSGNHHDAEDIAQDVFLKLYTGLRGFRHEAQFTSWLHRVVMHQCIDHARSRAPACRFERPEDEASEPAAPQPGPEREAYAVELAQCLHRALDRLPPGQRLVFTMRHFEELKLHEIADALGLADGTVKRQLHTAIRRLRDVLRAVDPEWRMADCDMRVGSGT